jgi:hypothetical protein
VHNAKSCVCRDKTWCVEGLEQIDGYLQCENNEFVFDEILNCIMNLSVGRSVIYCIITKKGLEDTRTTKRGKSKKWNHFLKEI